MKNDCFFLSVFLFFFFLRCTVPSMMWYVVCRKRNVTSPARGATSACQPAGLDCDIQRTSVMNLRRRLALYCNFHKKITHAVQFEQKIHPFCYLEQICISIEGKREWEWERRGRARSLTYSHMHYLSSEPLPCSFSGGENSSLFLNWVQS